MEAFTSLVFLVIKVNLNYKNAQKFIKKEKLSKVKTSRIKDVNIALSLKASKNYKNFKI